jgi:hypothetical protein
MAGRDNFYMATAFQRGGVPHATFPARVMYPADGFGFKTVYVSANPHFVTSAYGDPYGWSKSWIADGVKIRYTRSDLEDRKANVSTYDHYDAVSSMIASGRAFSDIEAFPNYSQFTTLASNDAAALLKTAYWLAVGFLTLNDTSLRDAAKERLEGGLRSGFDVNAANRSGSIKSTYDSAYVLLDKAMKRRGGSDDVATDALELLRRGTDRRAIAARVDEAQKQTTERQDVEDAPPPKKPDVPCEDTWRSYIPGYCTAQATGEMLSLGIKIAGGVLVAGVAIWGVKRLIKQAKANPLSEGYNPTKKKPMPRRALLQEQELAKTVFRKRIA